MTRRKTIGCLGAMLFLLIGAIFSGIGYFLLLAPELKVNRSFVEGNCTVLGKELVVSSRTSKSGKKKLGGGSKKDTYRPEFHIRHEVDGTPYESRTFRIVDSSSSRKSGQEAILARFEVGKEYPCWYDPADPANVVLEKGVSLGSIAMTGLGILFVVLGAGGGFLSIIRRLIRGNRP